MADVTSLVLVPLDRWCVGGPIYVIGKKVWPNTAFQSATISQLACPVTALMFSCSGTQCTTPER